MIQCKYCGIQIKFGEYCSDCAIELNLTRVEPDISQIPDKIEPIVAYRAWAIRNGKLGAVVKDTVLEPYQKNEATCTYLKTGHYSISTHTVPDKDCSCGFYAFKEFSIEILSGQIFGEVYLWGKIIPHKSGYRAQYCYPKRLYTSSLYYDDNGKAEIEETAQIYGIKTIEFKQVTEFRLCNCLDDYAQHSNKPSTLKEEDNAIISINYVGKILCSVCGSHDKCYTDERNHYFYCVKCLNNRVKQRHIETYLHAVKMSIKENLPYPNKIEGY